MPRERDAVCQCLLSNAACLCSYGFSNDEKPLAVRSVPQVEAIEHHAVGYFIVESVHS